MFITAIAFDESPTVFYVSLVCSCTVRQRCNTSWNIYIGFTSQLQPLSISNFSSDLGSSLEFLASKIFLNMQLCASGWKGLTPSPRTGCWTCTSVRRGRPPAPPPPWPPARNPRWWGSGRWACSGHSHWPPAGRARWGWCLAELAQFTSVRESV